MMPICKNCDKHFPNRLKIDGILFDVHDRKNCLECLPRGFTNIKYYSRKKNSPDNIFICSVCAKEYNYYRGKNSTSMCNACMSNRCRYSIKQSLVIYKGGKCERCGYNKCLRALDFHHRDPSTKLFNISGAHGRKWHTLLREVDKCILVCRNCHAEIEDDLVGIIRV